MRVVNEANAEGLRPLSDDAQGRLQQTADFREGAVAFVENRAPRWLGKSRHLDLREMIHALHSPI